MTFSLLTPWLHSFYSNREKTEQPTQFSQYVTQRSDLLVQSGLRCHWQFSENVQVSS